MAGEQAPNNKISGRRGVMGGFALALAGCGAAPALAATGAADKPANDKLAARLAALPRAFAKIEAARGGRLGVAVLNSGTGQQAGHRLAERFPMGSTYKLLAAAGVLARVDAGQDRLDRRIRFTRQQVVTYSPLTESQVGGEGMTLAALCEAAIVISDNTAGNLLLEPLGGPAGMTAWLRSLGDRTTRLDRIEPALNEAAPGDPRDTTSPAAMLASLRALALGPALSANGQAQLQSWLRANKTGDARLRARLPTGWQAGEKTGTSSHGTTNDVGLLWPPDGAAPLLVAAFLTESTAEGPVREAALADVGQAIALAWQG
jgi:beta-lactamase class A